jgi:internalin A
MTQDELLALIERAAAENWTELDLSGQGLTELPPEIGKLTQLEILILGRWAKDELGPQRRKGQELLGGKWVPLVFGNGFTTLPTELQALKNLKRLDISGICLDGLPDWLAQLPCLETLIAIRSELSAIPDTLAQSPTLQSLSLSSNQISVIPDALAQCSALQSLNLSSNQISVIPDALAQCSALQSLNLSSNQISVIPDALGQCSALQSLNLNSNQISVIPDALGQCSSLQSLNLNSNQISVIPDAIAQCPALQTLNLNSNQISVIPDAIAQCPALQTLNLNSNQISVIPDAIAQCPALQTLNLNSNQISVIPDAIAQCPALQTLNLNSNQISVIPDAIAQCPALQTLHLNSNQISVIPDAIAQCPALQTLNLNSNQISVIPDALAQCPALQTLNLNSNQISVIPDALGQCSALQSLFLDSNQISAIPDALGHCSALQRLDLDSNQISVIPNALAHNPALKILFLQSNQIGVIPDALGQSPVLKSLYLNSNQISAIPDALGQSPSLKLLGLNSNQISVIPDTLGQCSALQSLNLNSNQISVIPDALAHSPSTAIALILITIKFLRCQPASKTYPSSSSSICVTIPYPFLPEILEPSALYQSPGVAGIFNYLHQLRSGEVKPLNEAKLLLVGQGSVGKTSLVNRLLHDRFNPNESQTDGLTVRQWGVHVNAKDVRLNVWDFGGQEIYHATHQFFLTKRSLYLLVANCRTSEDENRIEYWLKLIQSFGGKSPVIIVGNKKDEQPLDINRKALRTKYPNICAIIETSCQSGDGIEKLRSTITTEVGKLHDVYNLLPLSWFQVKEQLEAMDRDFISYSEYIGICYQNQIPEEHNQDQLITLLHNLGLVLNFREHDFLKTTNVLNPDWVTQGIYALLSDDRLKTEGKGILTEDDLGRVLNQQRIRPIATATSPS